MANWEILKNAVSQVIKTNGNEEITGQILQDILITIINNIGEGYRFVKYIDPSNLPESRAGDNFYLATKKGVYSNFSGLTFEKNGLYLVYSSDSSNFYSITLFEDISDAVSQQIESAVNLVFAVVGIDTFNLDFSIKGKYLSGSGALLDNSDWSATELTDISVFEKIVNLLECSVLAHCLFYDAANTIIGKYQVSADQYGLVVPKPENAKYIRLSALSQDRYPIAYAVASSQTNSKTINHTSGSHENIDASLNKWSDGDYNKFVVLKMPNIDYGGGIIARMNIDFWYVDSFWEGSSAEKQLCDSIILTVAFFSNGALLDKSIGLNNCKGIKSVQYGLDTDGSKCLIFELNTFISVNSFDVKVSKIFSFAKSSLDVFGVSVANTNDISNYSNVLKLSMTSVEGHVLQDKSVVLEGDSITAGYNKGNYTTDYPDLITLKGGPKSLNRLGVSGGTIAMNANWNIYILSDDRLSNIVAIKPDVLILMAGVNDYQTDAPLGTWKSDRTTTCGSLAYAFNYLLKALPNLRIFYCTSGGYYYKPINMNAVQSGRDTNNLGLNLRQYFDACAEVAKMFSIPVIDFNKNCGWLDYNEVDGSLIYTSDGLHLSYNGYDRLTTLQINTIKEHINK